MNETTCFLDDALATTNQFIELHRMVVNCFIIAAQVAGYSSVIGHLRYISIVCLIDLVVYL